MYIEVFTFVIYGSITWLLLRFRFVGLFNFGWIIIIIHDKSTYTLM